MQASRIVASTFTLALVLAISPIGVPALAQSYGLVELSQTESKAYGINNFSQVVGWYKAGTDHHGFHWSSGEFVDIQDTTHLSTLLVFTEPWSEIYAVSDADQLVGAGRANVKCIDATITITSALLLRPATITDFATPMPGDAVVDLGSFNPPCESPNSAVTAISNNFHLVGWADWNWLSLGRGGPHHAFLVQPSNGRYYIDANGDGVNDLITDLGAFDGLAGTGSVSAAAGVNDNGVIVGHSYLDGALAAYHAFMWAQNGTAGPAANPQMEDLGTLGGTNSLARAINNNNQVVGESDTAQFQTHAFLWQNDAMTSLGTFGGTHSSAAAINDTGQIVGWAETSEGVRHAFFWENGLMVDLNDLLPSGSALVLSEARDINERGEIVGWGKDRSSEITRAFLLKPAAGGGVMTDPSSTSGTSGTTSGSGTSLSGSPDTDPLLTPQVVDDPMSTDVAGNTAENPPADALTPAPCGLGVVGMLPLMVLGLCWMKSGRPNVRSRR